MSPYSGTTGFGALILAYQLQHGSAMHAAVPESLLMLRMVVAKETCACTITTMTLLADIRNSSIFAL